MEKKGARRLKRSRFPSYQVLELNGDSGWDGQKGGTRITIFINETHVPHISRFLFFFLEKKLIVFCSVAFLSVIPDLVVLGLSASAD
jgi:hypothetical protein